VLLISDVVNSERVPELLDLADSALPSFLRERAERGGTIRGMNPSKIIVILRRDPVLASKIAGVELVAPWRWKLHQRIYVVWASRWRIS
jgi:hypothetical protein